MLMKKIVLFVLFCLFAAGCEQVKVERLSDSEKEALITYAQTVVPTLRNSLTFFKKYPASEAMFVRNHAPELRSVVYQMSRMQGSRPGGQTLASEPVGSAKCVWDISANVSYELMLVGDLTQPKNCTYMWGRVVLSTTEADPAEVRESLKIAEAERAAEEAREQEIYEEARRTLEERERAAREAQDAIEKL